jgi:hypothetical protein
MADPVNLIDRQTLLANFLVAGWPALAIPGIPRVSAAAAVGNATQENQVKSVTLGELDHGSDGLFQWRQTRLTAMQAFAAKWFTTWEAIEPQAAFFSFECKGSYPALWADLVAGTKPLATLVANICDQYEMPAAASAALDARIKYAQTFLDAWPSHTPAPPPSIAVATPVAAPSPQTPPPLPSLVSVLPPAPAPVSRETPPDLTEGNIAVIKALASAITTSNNPVDIAALANAILKELS